MPQNSRERFSERLPEIPGRAELGGNSEHRVEMTRTAFCRYIQILAIEEAVILPPNGYPRPAPGLRYILI